MVEDLGSGKLFCCPSSASQMLVIDPATNTCTSMDIPNVHGEENWSGIAAGDDGMLYCCPSNASTAETTTEFHTESTEW